MAKTGKLTFEAFWDAYALKRDRIAAERAWNRLGAKDKRAAMQGIAAYRKDCEAHNRMMMYAQGYLNHRRWEDELAEDNAQCAGKAGQPGGERRQDAILQHAIDLREKERQERERRYEEMHRNSVSREDAMKSDEYWKAMQEA